MLVDLLLMAVADVVEQAGRSLEREDVRRICRGADAEMIEVIERGDVSGIGGAAVSAPASSAERGPGSAE